MQISSLAQSVMQAVPTPSPKASLLGAMQQEVESPVESPVDDHVDDSELRETFQQFVGETLFGQLLKSMRKTQDKPAYFHGGRAEEVFQQQLDQVLAEKIAKTSSERFFDPMFELFTLKRG